MTDLAETQIQRLVHLIAWMSQRDSDETIPFSAAARGMGVTEAEVRADLQVLVELTEVYRSWLASLSVALTADGFSVGSRGAFRRPLRLSRDESLALLIGLTGSREGHSLAVRLGRTLGAAPAPTEVERAWAMGPTPGEQVAQVLALARRARDERRKLRIRYGASNGETTERRVHPQQVVQARGVWYIVAWCEQARGGRHFRAERVLEADLLAERFVPRRDLRMVKGAKDLLRTNAVPMATVAFSRRVARWLRELYPEGVEGDDGRYLVRLPVADQRWLAREVLQYGPEAEILSPIGMREFLQTLLA
jgi:predicted DNA-binding transcriptional regulator YafY